MAGEVDITRLDRIVALVRNEVHLAAEQHAPYNSMHEGYAVIKEEFDELWDEIKVKDRDRAKILKECIQVAATAMRFMHDLFGDEDHPRPSA